MKKSTAIRQARKQVAAQKRIALRPAQVKKSAKAK